ncbi:MAG TPA: riboflavin synthase [Alphaproteobacteria bacterium]|jgi:riboflavin synthase
MFTGIISDVGRVRRVVPGTDLRLDIETVYDPAGIALGASIACSGVCLTVIEKGTDAGKHWFAVEASPETLSLTTLAKWGVDNAVNLERAMKLGDEFGGHIVSGHVDGVGEVVSATPVGDKWGSTEFVFRAPSGLMPYIAAKGSVALNGVSLTVNRVEDDRFAVNVIPHTLKETTFGAAKAGDPVNIEIDMLARYVARALGKD